jgi:hypothetical protein
LLLLNATDREVRDRTKRHPCSYPNHEQFHNATSALDLRLKCVLIRSAYALAEARPADLVPERDSPFEVARDFEDPLAWPAPPIMSSMDMAFPSAF